VDAEGWAATNGSSTRARLRGATQRPLIMIAPSPIRRWWTFGCMRIKWNAAS